MTKIKTKWSRGNRTLVRKCPACGSQKITESYKRRDDTLSLPDTWQYVRCKDCGSLYLVDRPDNDSLPLAYASYYTHEEKADPAISGQTIAIKLINGYLNMRFGMQRINALSIGYALFWMLFPLRMKLDVYGRHIPKELPGSQATLLDVGCGNGDFLLRAQEMGFKASGCEPDIHAVATCKKKGLDVITGNIDSFASSKARFDYITLNHVIEHVEDPRITIANLYHLLNPSGWVWLALPNPDAIGRIFFSRGWKGFHPPYHLLIPSQCVLLEWLNEAGFAEIHIVRAGLQSKGLWRESIAISKREGKVSGGALTKVVWYFSNILSCFSARWGEETIIMARRPAEKNDN